MISHLVPHPSDRHWAVNSEVDTFLSTLVLSAGATKEYQDGTEKKHDILEQRLTPDSNLNALFYPTLLFPEGRSSCKREVWKKCCQEPYYHFYQANSNPLPKYGKQLLHLHRWATCCKAANSTMKEHLSEIVWMSAVLVKTRPSSRDFRASNLSHEQSRQSSSFVLEQCNFKAFSCLLYTSDAADDTPC
eukprot:2133518-Amphidinium_carterae.1